MESILGWIDDIGREKVFIIIAVGLDYKSNLPQIIDTFYAHCCSSCFTQCRKQHTCKNGDDGYNYQ